MECILSKHGTEKMVVVGLKKIPARYADKPFANAFRKALSNVA